MNNAYESFFFFLRIDKGASNGFLSTRMHANAVGFRVALDEELVIILAFYFIQFWLLIKSASYHDRNSINMSRKYRGMECNQIIKWVCVCLCVGDLTQQPGWVWYPKKIETHSIRNKKSELILKSTLIHLYIKIVAHLCPFHVELEVERAQV